jgi:hypothetical protein
MRLRLAILGLIACSTSALAQSGVSTQRDGYGNLLRDSGAYQTRGVNQGPINNGPIRNAPAQPPTNASAAKGATR